MKTLRNIALALILTSAVFCAFVVGCGRGAKPCNCCKSCLCADECKCKAGKPCCKECKCK